MIARIFPHGIRRAVVHRSVFVVNPVFSLFASRRDPCRSVDYRQLTTHAVYDIKKNRTRVPITGYQFAHSFGVASALIHADRETSSYYTPLTT